MKRRRMSKRKSNRLFRRTAGSHPKNHITTPLRGGIRL